MFGVQFGMVAMPVIAVESLAASELQMGVLNAAGVAAFLLVGLPAGAWVDRWLKRPVMIWADLVRAATVLVVPVLWMLEVLAMWHLYVVAAVIGVATVFFDVSYQSYVPILVPRSRVPEANSKLETTAQIARIGGPGVGGVLLKVISAPFLLVSDAIGYLVSAACLGRVHDREQPSKREDHPPLGQAIAEGLAFVWGHPLIRPITMCTALANFSSTIMFTLGPILYLRLLDFEPWVMGVLISFGSVGGILGAVASRRLGEWIGEGMVIPVSALVSGLTMVAWPVSAVLSQTGAFVLLALADLAFGFAVVAYNVQQVSMRQRVCPERLLGRMNASIRFVVWGVMPISALLAGVLGDQLGVVAALWIAVALGFTASVPVVFSPLWGLKRLPDGES